MDDPYKGGKTTEAFNRAVSEPEKDTPPAQNDAQEQAEKPPEHNYDPPSLGAVPARSTAAPEHGNGGTPPNQSQISEAFNKESHRLHSEEQIDAWATKQQSDYLDKITREQGQMKASKLENQEAMEDFCAGLSEEDKKKVMEAAKKDQEKEASKLDNEHSQGWDDLVASEKEVREKGIIPDHTHDNDPHHAKDDFERD